MIAAKQNLPAGQLGNISKIRHGFRQISSPTVISCEQQRIILCQKLETVLFKLLFMLLPDPVFQLILCLQRGKKMKMQISDRVQTHDYSPNRAVAFSIRSAILTSNGHRLSQL